MSKSQCLPASRRVKSHIPTLGVFATGDPRVDAASRQRAINIVKITAGIIAGAVTMPDKTPARVVLSPILVDREVHADIVASQFHQSGVNILICVPDTWAFPQLSLISLLQQFPADTPVNLTCGNSGPKPGVVFTHAASGAISQYGRLIHINVGTWPDRGARPKMTENTARNPIDWCYAALTTRGP